jgi:hypothetical protein
LLFPKYRRDLVEEIARGRAPHRLPIERGVTTNAILVDDEWAARSRPMTEVTAASTVRLTSTTGSGRFRGRGTLAATLRGIGRLRAAGIEPGLISVCNPGTECSALAFTSTSSILH